MFPRQLIIVGHNGSISEKSFEWRNAIYYMPINDTSFELSVFLLSDTESQINELRFSEPISLVIISFKTRLTSVTCFCVC